MLVAYAQRKKGDRKAVDYALRVVFRRMWTGLGGGKESSGLLAASSGKRCLVMPVYASGLFVLFVCVLVL